MFESVQQDDAAQRLRHAAIFPMAAFLFAQAYFLVYPLLPAVPATLFWFVVLVLVAGATRGFASLLRVARSEPMRGRALAWLIAASLAELACIAQMLAMTVPWLL